MCELSCGFENMGAMELPAGFAEHVHPMVAEGKEGYGHPDDHHHDGEQAGEPVVVEQVEIVHEVVLTAVAQTFEQRLDGAVGKLTRHHGEQGGEGKPFGGRLDPYGRRDREHTDGDAAGKGGKGEVDTIAQQNKAGHVPDGCQECAGEESASVGIADAGKTHSSNGGEETIIEEL